MSTARHLLVVVLFLPPAIIALAFSPPIYLVTFMGASVLAYFAGNSRRVTDPVVGIGPRTMLCPEDFHRWAFLVCTSDRYMKAYEGYVYSKRGYDEKLPLVFSQIKAINYVHVWKVLILLLVVLDVFLIYDLYYSNLTFAAPIAVGSVTGILFGYSLGLYQLSRQCRRSNGNE